MTHKEISKNLFDRTSAEADELAFDEVTIGDLRRNNYWYFESLYYDKFLGHVLLWSHHAIRETLSFEYRLWMYMSPNYEALLDEYRNRFNL